MSVACERRNKRLVVRARGRLQAETIGIPDVTHICSTLFAVTRSIRKTQCLADGNTGHTSMEIVSILDGKTGPSTALAAFGLGLSGRYHVPRVFHRATLALVDAIAIFKILVVSTLATHGCELVAIHAVGLATRLTINTSPTVNTGAVIAARNFGAGGSVQTRGGITEIHTVFAIKTRVGGKARTKVAIYLVNAGPAMLTR
jgi:hypothetical protein